MAQEQKPCGTPEYISLFDEICLVLHERKIPQEETASSYVSKSEIESNYSHQYLLANIYCRSVHWDVAGICYR
ncbi:hypothetical protein JTB14_028706 [Gonioctena quinquepunctata]|nr:hypothetical protein JTB14_028706 [Gonioctena quinquepunctata]